MENMVMENLFSGIYSGKKILVTGNTGFKGSWLALWLQRLGAEVTGFSLDNISPPSHFHLLQLPYKTFYGDIRNAKEIEECIAETKPELIFHLAAQSLVSESYRDPVSNFTTNIIGTVNVLEAVRKSSSVKAVINVTTDKVYENHNNKSLFKETDPLGGDDPYSASKACSEIISSSYAKSFLADKGILVATVRSGNVIGGGDWSDDRIIPDLIRATISGKSAAIRKPQSVRPWQHVLEVTYGYLLLGQKLLEEKMEFASSFNFGPASEQYFTVHDLCEAAQRQWGKIKYESASTESNFKEADWLQLDSSKAKIMLGWKNAWSFDDSIAMTVNWYKNYYEKNKLQSEENLNKYIEDAVKAGVVK